MKQGSATWESTTLWHRSGELRWDSGAPDQPLQRRWSEDEPRGLETETESESNAELARAQIVARLLELNPSATLDYLAQFDDGALRNYLDHLETAQRPRGPRSRWVRRGDSRAIVGREAEY